MEHPSAQTGLIAERRKSLRILFIIGVIAFAVAEGAYQIDALLSLDQVYTDLWHRLSGKRYAPSHVALVEIDETSLSKNEDPLVFWAPAYARALATLRQVGASIVGVDFLLITPEIWLQKYGLSNSEGLKNYDLPFRQELNAGKTVLVGAVRPGDQGQNDGFQLPHVEYLLSLPNSDITSYIGLADLVVDSDGSIRRYAVAPKLKLDAETAKSAPRLTLSALLSIHATQQSAVANEWQLGGRRYDVTSVHNVSYTGPPGTIPRISFYKLLANDATHDPEIQSLRGKVVIIGGNYEGMNDVVDTPYSNGILARKKFFMTGAEIQANIVETLLSGKTTNPAPMWTRWLIFALLLFAVLAIAQRLTPWTGAGVTLLVAVGALAVGYCAFQGFALLPVAPLQLGLVSGFIMLIGTRLTREEREKQRVKHMFEGYVSDDVVNMLLSSDQRLDLGGQSMRITVLFSDIRNFTTITEQLSAHEAVEFLNAYFEKVIEIIRAEGGRIDKFIGDAVMAEFGVPYPFSDHALRALRAAIAMRDNAETFRQWMQRRFPDRHIPDFSIGIGLHTGDAVVGNLGSKKRMEFTAIGDTVNVASRLEGETKTLNCVIVASAETVHAAGGNILTGQHELLSVKGRAQPVEVYEITGFSQ